MVNLVLNVSEREDYCTTASQINFAVPNQIILRSFNPYRSLRDTMSDLRSKLENLSACLTYDGKKIKQGLTCDSGDVKLVGFENGETLKESKEK